jgi:hypothetical protein
MRRLSLRRSSRLRSLFAGLDDCGGYDGTGYVRKRGRGGGEDGFWAGDHRDKLSGLKRLVGCISHSDGVGYFFLGYETAA